jgi:hypothetical protein
LTTSNKKKSPQLTPEILAKALFDSFEADGWGDIDPSLFGCVARGDLDGEYASDLLIVLQRAVKALGRTKSK